MLSPEKWQLVDSIFQKIIDFSPEKREQVITELAGKDAELAEEIKSLVLAFDHVPDFLEKPAARMLEWNDDDALPQAFIGRQIGFYRVVKELGRGGMGMVFLAERADGQFEKQVALKIMRRGVENTQLFRRFQAERQMLAQLDHPNIAKLLDGGLTDDGLPYLVMEYIEGVPIDAYCDQHQLNITERIKLFLQVSAAVGYLHQNLIVHRDLKPGNIIVTNAGVPFLLDFGIAKLLNSVQSRPGETLTQAGMWLMTPDYASPEQVCGEPITTASDVYSAGVLLYKLLTGHRPYQFESCLPQDIITVICQKNPRRPSTVIQNRPVPQSAGSDTEIVPDPVFMSREGSFERLQRRLKGDLDQILLKALNKEPQRRYQSIQGFSDDLQRHLEGLPVQAQKSTWLYHARKFIMRNRFRVISGLTLFILLIIFVTSIIRQSIQITKERDKAQQITNFIVDIFKVADPEISQGDTITVREILDRGAHKIRTELAEQPEIKASMMDVMGQVYQNLGLFYQADTLFQEALTIYSRIFDNYHKEMAQILLHNGNLQLTLDRPVVADSLITSALEINKKLFSEKSIEYAENLEILAKVKMARGDYNQGKSLALAAYLQKRKLLSDDNLMLAQTLQILGDIYILKVSSDSSEFYYQKAYQIRLAKLGIRHPLTIESMYGVARSLYRQSKFDKVEPILLKTLELQKQLYGPNSPSVASTLVQVAGIYYFRKEFEKSELLAKEILEIRQKIFGPYHSEVALDYNNVAALLTIQNKNKEAISYYKKAIEILNRNNTRTPLYFRIISSLLFTLYVTQNYTEASYYINVLTPMVPKMLEEEPPVIGYFNMQLSLFLLHEKKYVLAEQKIREGIELYKSQFNNSKHLVYEDAKNLLGECLTAQGRFTEAETLLVNSFPIIEKARTKTHLLTITALKRIINLYETWGKPEKARIYQAMLNERITPGKR